MRADGLRRAAAWLALVPCAALAACGTIAGPAGIGDQAGAAAAAPAGWGQARQVPGTETFSQQANSNDGKSYVGTGLTSVACSARGDCAASGGYVNGGFNFLEFVAAQHAGKWARAEVVPGDVALVGAGGVAGSDEMDNGPFLGQVSCSSAGNCALAGNYQDASTSQTRPLVASERAGVWGKVQPVSVSGQADALVTISCPAQAGNCAAGGAQVPPFSAPRGASAVTNEPLVVSEKGGTWGPAQLISGTSEAITTMSCPAAGDCLAAGAGYLYGSGFLTKPFGTAFLVTERNGRWAAAGPVPGLSRLAGHRASSVGSVHCVATGNCTVGGSYVDAAGHAQVYVASERGGVWGRPLAMPGLAALNKGANAGVTQVSCTGPGTCAAGGWYWNIAGRAFQQAWVAAETGGRWGKAERVPGTHALDTAGVAAVTSVSCVRAECAAGGWYTTGGTQQTHAFLVTGQNGRWGNAAKVPGLAALNPRADSLVTSLSCVPSGWCTAVGDYDALSGEIKMFEVSQR
ncbi:MAG TPA: hypothetical protein VHU92_13450 [Streptosporangiaceae bacterium]|jgi:hypothetical protein|nr:hypothetical protein [Streptosporangiaceae bacterium]